MIMRILIPLVMLLLLGACSRNLETVKYVDIPRFMGDWYVIAILPNFIEKNAYNGLEQYRLAEDGTIVVTYSYRKGSAQGILKVMHPRGRIYNHQTNAEWRMQLFKPFWSKYFIVDLADDYRYTAIGVPNRKFFWIMSRSPQMSTVDYDAVLARLQSLDFNTAKIIKMPQEW